MKYSRPIEISDADLTFPSGAMNWMPAWEEIPEEFQRGDTVWNKLAEHLFFGNLAGIQVESADGVDTTKALRHIMAIMRSFAPKHEHKLAACAFLMSQFFTKVQFEDRP